MATNFICVTCGVQYAATDNAPEHCLICEDPRQYIGWQGQQWTTLETLQAENRNEIKQEEEQLWQVITRPQVAIGECARLAQTAKGNVLWECVSLVDDATVQEIQKLGGISAIAISHPHFYSSMVEWSKAFGGVPIYLHEDNQPWVMRPDPAIVYWSGDTYELGDGLTLIRCGGHFPGSSVLHWQAGAAGRGALLTGDTIMVASDRNFVSFMYSYPNYIPLNAPAVEQVVAAVEPFEFDRIYSSWPERVCMADGKKALRRSRDRYLQAISTGL